MSYCISVNRYYKFFTPLIHLTKMLLNEKMLGGKSVKNKKKTIEYNILKLYTFTKNDIFSSIQFTFICIALFTIHRLLSQSSFTKNAFTENVLMLQAGRVLLSVRYECVKVMSVWQ